MPILPNVPSVIRVQLKHTLGADLDVLSRLYFQYSGAAPTVGQLNTMCTTVGTNWNTTMAGQANPVCSLTEVLITDLSSPTSAQAAVAVSHAGTRTGQANPAATCVLLGFPIARRYRGGKPRVYLPYLNAGDLATDQTWGAGSLSTLVTDWATFTGDIETAIAVWGTSGIQVNVSYYESFTLVVNPITGRGKNVAKLRVGGPVVDTVTSIVANTRPASQRRRNLQRS
jgi:hypothetical protein